jgi:uncharacterized protein YlxW (UPF0749 family)
MRPATAIPRDSMSLLTEIASAALDQTYPVASGRPQPRSRVPVAAGFVVAAVLLTVAATTAHQDAPTASRQRTALGEAATDRAREVAGLAAALGRLRTQVAAAQAANARAAGALRATRADVGRLGLLAGAAAVTGPGVVVRVDDRGRDRARVTDTDLQLLSNALWAAGAEAVAIDGQRVTALTAIRSAGAAILVDFRPVMAPYVVTAVGDPDRLADRFADAAVARRLRTTASVYGGAFSVRPAARLTLAASRGLAAPR